MRNELSQKIRQLFDHMKKTYAELLEEMDKLWLFEEIDKMWLIVYASYLQSILFIQEVYALWYELLLNYLIYWLHLLNKTISSKKERFYSCSH